MNREIEFSSTCALSALPSGLGRGEGSRAGNASSLASAAPASTVPPPSRPLPPTQIGREGGGSGSRESTDLVTKVAILDLGIGNLGNVARALRHVGGEVSVTTDPALVASSRCLVLPGVGAFRPPRERLRGELEAALRAAVAGGAWLLGICVGYQLLFEESSEFGITDGLGLLPGRVEALPGGVPLPHIGWNRLSALSSRGLFAGVAEGEYVYFVHGYAPLRVPAGAGLAAATHGVAFVAAAGRGRVMGTQFHPERSGDTGLRVLRNYLEMARGSAAGD